MSLFFRWTAEVDSRPVEGPKKNKKKQKNTRYSPSFPGLT